MTNSIQHETVRILKHQATIIKRPQDDNCSPYHWNLIFDLALILRDKEYLNLLLQIPIWDIHPLPFFHAAYAKLRYYIHTQQFDQAEKQYEIVTQKSESNETIFHGIKGKKIVQAEGLSKQMKLLNLPLVKLYQLILKKEGDQFNLLLEKYLISKKKWIKKNKEDGNSKYWIDRPLLSICSFAHDQGLNITVESDYIPAWLYRKEFDVEQVLEMGFLGEDGEVS